MGETGFAKEHRERSIEIPEPEDLDEKWKSGVQRTLVIAPEEYRDVVREPAVKPAT